MRDAIHFNAGALAITGLYMAYSDFLGQEVFIARAQASWIDLHWSVGAVVFVCAYLLHVVWRTK